MKHPVIIGAGGVASYLLPVLIKTFGPKSITIVDKDVLEKRNLDRQLFKDEQIGQSKAQALADLWIPKDIKVNIVTEWFEFGLPLPEDFDLLVCVADNHKARCDALLTADTSKRPCVLGGNEYLDNEAYIYYPRWKGTKRDPRVAHPELLTTGDEGSPLACTGLAQIGSPQLAIANSGCATKILHLLWVWERFAKKEKLNPEALDCLPHELCSSLTRHDAISARELASA